MFTGLVQCCGRVVGVTALAKGASLEIEAPFSNLELGESIAVYGTCLTVTRLAKERFVVDASDETLNRTTLSELKVGSRVHLERALALGERLGGHLVSGHVDGVGMIAKREELGDSVKVTFEVPSNLGRFIAPKGSVTVDGVSLTPNGVLGSGFDVVLVPFTRRETTFDERPLGSRVNIEVDILAKYLARLLGQPGIDEPAAENGVTLDLLARQGYL